jgi:apolipoprotein D and lipocalin family protein
MRGSVIFVAVALVFGAAIAAAAQAPPLRAVESFDLTRYAGKWYEIARLPNKFQARCQSDVVARYAVRPDGRIDIINQCRAADRTLVESRGIARTVKTKPLQGKIKKDAILQIRFAPAFFSFLPSVWGDYWVIGLGPDYTWAVVGEPSRRYMWILSRAPSMSASSYEQALAIAAGNGFDVTKVARTPQKNNDGARLGR